MGDCVWNGFDVLFVDGCFFYLILYRRCTKGHCLTSQHLMWFNGNVWILNFCKLFHDIYREIVEKRGRTQGHTNVKNRVYLIWCIIRPPSLACQPMYRICPCRWVPHLYSLPELLHNSPGSLWKFWNTWPLIYTTVEPVNNDHFYNAIDCLFSI